MAANKFPPGISDADKARYTVFHNAVIRCTKLYNEDPTASKLRDLRAAEKGFADLKTELAEAAPAKKEAIPASIAAEAAAENLEPLEYMLKVMNDPTAPDERRDKMAVAAAPFVHRRTGEKGGKKGDRAEAAKRAAAGKFAPGVAPYVSTRVQ